MRLVEALRADDMVDVEYLVVDPVLPAPFDRLQRIAIVRTIVTSLRYVMSLLANAWRYDTLHVFSASYWSFLLAPVPAMVVGRLFGRRVLLNYHSGEADDHLTRWGWHAKPLLRLADAIVVPTDYLVEVFAKHGLQAMAIPNHLAVAPGIVARSGPVVPRFFSNRNFESHYNVSAIIEAFAGLLTAWPEAELVIAGGGSQRGALEQRCRELGVQQRCRFTGPVAPERMAALYADADVYVNASLIDNMPLSILEAYAARLPVVTSDAGGIPWIARDQETALLVPAGDVSALREAMRVAVTDRAAALHRAEQAHRFVRDTFSWEAVRARWLGVYAAGAQGALSERPAT